MGIDDRTPRSTRRARDRAAAQAWARGVLASDDWVILDTETTGLDETAEVIQIGILAPDGSVLLDALIRPDGNIPPAATAVHGITEGDVRAAPTYPEIDARLAAVLYGKTIISFNAAFDRRLMRQTAARYRMFPPCKQWDCAMLQYAKYVGDLHHSYGTYRFQRLPPIAGNQVHSALGDCRAVLALIQRMAAAT